MAESETPLNKAYLCLELNEAREAISSLIEKIEHGGRDDFGPMALSFDFDHILSHLCTAWHCAWLSKDRISRLTADEYETMHKSVPNWSMDLRLVDPNVPIIGESGPLREG